MVSPGTHPENLDSVENDASASAHDQNTVDKEHSALRVETRPRLNLDSSVGVHSPLTSDNVRLADTIANSEMAAEIDADTETVARSDPNTETAARTAWSRGAVGRRQCSRKTTQTTAQTDEHSETAAETDANTGSVARPQIGGANTPPIARDQIRTARFRGEAGARQSSRKTEPDLRTARNLPVIAAAGSLSKKYQLWTPSDAPAFWVLCSVVALFLGILGTTVFTGPRRSASEATPSPTVAQLITPDGGPQARQSQVSGAPASTALAPAVEERLRALLSTAPGLEPKLTPSSAQSTQIAVGQDRPQQRSAIKVSPPAMEASASDELQGPPLQERSTARQLNSDEISALISRGSDFFKAGDFSAARILLQRGAESGSADAALMLGKTFDPLFLREIGAIGIKADVAQCRQWYQKAVELGSETAAQRLAHLAQPGQ